MPSAGKLDFNGMIYLHMKFENISNDLLYSSIQAGKKLLYVVGLWRSDCHLDYAVL
jgi:hypothetical protein